MVVGDANARLDVGKVKHAVGDGIGLHLHACNHAAWECAIINLDGNPTDSRAARAAGSYADAPD
jgi:hypothetical protein